MMSIIKSWHSNWKSIRIQKKNANSLADVMTDVFRKPNEGWFSEWKRKRANRNFVRMTQRVFSKSPYKDFDMREIMRVQPMDLPSNLVFPMDFVYSKEGSDKLDRDEFEYAKKKLLDQYNSEKVHEPIKDLDTSNVKEQRYISDDGKLVIYRYDNGGWHALAGRAGFVLFERGLPVGYVGTRMS